jgi:[protein-PII] uridylyltransferase
MSPRYLLYASADEIHRHLALAGQLGGADFIWHVDRGADPDTRRVTVCAKDRPGLFSKIAGVFTLNGVDILDAQIFTWRNNLALDIFEVKPPPDRIFEQERWLRAESHLREALAGRLDIGARLESRTSGGTGRPGRLAAEPPSVVVDNEASSFFTIIEVFSNDFKGLLFRVTDALFRCGLDIWVAKIATKVDQVVDVFYVRDFDGQKIIESRDVAAVKKAVLEALPGGGKAAVSDGDG